MWNLGDPWIEVGVEVARRRVSAALGTMLFSFFGRTITSVQCARAISCRRRLVTKLGGFSTSATTALQASDRAACSAAQSICFRLE